MAHDELAAVIIDVLLQRSLKHILDSRDTSPFRLRANLIFRDGIASVFNETAQFIRIHDIGEEAFDLPLVCQWFEFADNLIQFPNEPRLSDSGLDPGESGLTVPVSFSFLAPGNLLQMRVCRVRRKGL